MITPFTSASDAAQEVALQADGKLVAGGFAEWLTPSFGAPPDLALVRYNADGSLDSSFGVSGKLLVTETGVSALAVQRDRKILAVGTSRSAPDDFSVTRIDRNGHVDTGFALGGHVVTDFRSNSVDGALAAALQRDGKLVAVGVTAPTSQGPVDFALARYLASRRRRSASCPTCAARPFASRGRGSHTLGAPSAA